MVSNMNFPNTLMSAIGWTNRLMVKLMLTCWAGHDAVKIYEWRDKVVLFKTILTLKNDKVIKNLIISVPKT